MEKEAKYTPRIALQEAGLAAASAVGVALAENGDPVPAGFFVGGGVLGRLVDYGIESHQQYGSDNLSLVRGGVIFMWAAATVLASIASVKSGLTPDVPLGAAGSFVGSMQAPLRSFTTGVKEIYSNRKKSFKERKIRKGK